MDFTFYKKFLIPLFSIGICTLSFSQKIRFGYDSAGNQILRTVCPSCQSKISDSDPVMDYSKIEDSTLQKFFDGDVISYYPNPVLEELYIKWVNNTDKVTNIEIFGVNGQVLNKIDNLINQEFQVINFSHYPTGEYFLNLNYTDGEPKTIKIIKN